jgi:hypothetical protein
LQADLAAICRVVDAAAGSGVAEAGLRKCLEGAQLVGLPVKGGKSQTDAQSSTADDGGEDWEAWGGEVAETAEVESSGDTRTGNEELGLWEVEKRLFADNQSAREVLEDLNMELLSETEARAVLGRRVELAG